MLRQGPLRWRHPGDCGLVSLCSLPRRGYISAGLVSRAAPAVWQDSRRARRKGFNDPGFALRLDAGQFPARCLRRRGAVAEEFPGDGIRKCLKRRVHDVRRDADREPTIALAVGTLDHHTRHRFRTAGEDTDLVVGKAQIFDVGGVFSEILTQSLIERIDWTISLAHRDELLVIHYHLHRRLRDGHEIADGVVTALDKHTEGFDEEELRHFAQNTPREQFE